MWPLETSRRERRYPTVTVSIVSYTRGIGDILLTFQGCRGIQKPRKKEPISLRSTTSSNVVAAPAKRYKIILYPEKL